MNEAYVSFEVAKLLKEKGFNWKVFHFYDADGHLKHREGDCYSLYNWNYLTKDEYGSQYCSAPTQQMACRWLREEYKIFIEVGVGTDIDGVFGYMPSIYFLDILACNEGRFSPNVDADDICDFTPQTYEDAVEAALEYCLTNLI